MNCMLTPQRSRHSLHITAVQKQWQCCPWLWYKLKHQTNADFAWFQLKKKTYCVLGMSVGTFHVLTSSATVSASARVRSMIAIYWKIWQQFLLFVLSPTQSRQDGGLRRLTLTRYLTAANLLPLQHLAVLYRNIPEYKPACSMMCMAHSCYADNWKWIREEDAQAVACSLRKEPTRGCRT